MHRNTHVGEKQIYDVLLTSRNAYQEDVEQNTFPVKLTNRKVYNIFMKHTRRK